jgi:hypothetical protein
VEIARRLVRAGEQTGRELAQLVSRRVAVCGVRRGHPTVAANEHGGSDIGRQLVEIAQRELGSKRRVGHRCHDTHVTLPQASWLGVVLICLVAALLLLINGYVGYFGILLAVAASAAVNLR